MTDQGNRDIATNQKVESRKQKLGSEIFIPLTSCSTNRPYIFCAVSNLSSASTKTCTCAVPGTTASTHDRSSQAVPAVHNSTGVDGDRNLITCASSGPVMPDRAVAATTTSCVSALNTLRASSALRTASTA